MLAIDGVEMLDVREAAQLAGRTPETVRRWVWSGRLSAVRQGNRLLMSRREVDELVRGVSTSQPPSLAGWVREVEEHRRSGALPRAARGTSAADLVMADRRSREDG